MTFDVNNNITLATCTILANYRFEIIISSFVKIMYVTVSKSFEFHPAGYWARKF